MTAHDYETVRYEQPEPAIARIVMNRPEARNAQNLQAGNLDLSGLDANTTEKVAAATAINLDEWRQEFELQGEFFEKLKATMPPALVLQRQILMSRL